MGCLGSSVKELGFESTDCSTTFVNKLVGSDKSRLNVAFSAQMAH